MERLYTVEECNSTRRIADEFLQGQVTARLDMIVSEISLLREDVSALKSFKDRTIGLAIAVSAISGGLFGHLVAMFENIHH
jgi:predicted butyrate kinase (DUF1464 family)